MLNLNKFDGIFSKQKCVIQINKSNIQEIVDCCWVRRRIYLHVVVPKSTREISNLISWLARISVGVGQGLVCEQSNLLLSCVEVQHHCWIQISYKLYQLYWRFYQMNEYFKKKSKNINSHFISQQKLRLFTKNKIL